MNFQIESEKIRDIQEMGIVLAAKTLNPSVINQDFIQFSGIIPSFWQLVSQPVLNPNYAQLCFNNGLNLVAQGNSISFIQSSQGKFFQELAIADTARRFLEKIPFAEYQNLRIQLKSLIPFDDYSDSAREYITEKFLAPGSWQEIGKAPVEASINLLFKLDRRELNLSVNEARIQYNNADRATASGILFSGAFAYTLNNDPQARLKELNQILQDWRQDVLEFRNIIQKNFLNRSDDDDGQEELVLFPSRLA
jgi:hypothetical protein